MQRCHLKRCLVNFWAIVKMGKLKTNNDISTPLGGQNPFSLSNKGAFLMFTWEQYCQELDTSSVNSRKEFYL